MSKEKGEFWQKAAGSVRRLWIVGWSPKYIYTSEVGKVLCLIMKSNSLSEEDLKSLKSSMERELAELVGLLDNSDGSLYAMEKILEPGFNETKRTLLEKAANLKAKASSKKKL